jgi:hypothetical protein
MRQLGVACGTPVVVGKAELVSLCTDGTTVACVKSLEDADFSGCIIDGRPCRHAVKIHKSLDPSAAVLECRRHPRPMTIDDALACTSQE